MQDRKLRGGMVGGSFGSFVGPIHRMAMQLDSQAVLIAGAFDADPSRSMDTGRKLYLDASRVYASYLDMIQNEASMPDAQRLDYVTIATPNYLHLDVATRFLQAGFNVVCEKPVALTLAEAKRLKEVVAETGKVFGVMHTYSGYPMVKQARNIVRRGLLGNVHKVVTLYPQGWLSKLMSGGDTVLSMWRMDPKQAGISGVMADIGTHAEHLARYVTGLEIDELAADLQTFVPGNPLEDYGGVLIHYKGGACGVLCASQVSSGEENDFSIRVYGTKGSLYWHQEAPGYLMVKSPSGEAITYSQGSNSEVLADEVKEFCRLPLGHPEGYIEAFANIYREVFRAIRAKMNGHPVPVCDYPTVEDGVVGMAFVETVLASAKSPGRFVKFVQ